MKVNDKLIRAGDLFEAVRNDTSIRGSAFAAIRRHIDAAPAVEAKEVVHGQWYDPEDDGGGTLWRCSQCGHPLKTLGGYPNFDYCPDCGAKMDGEGRDEE